MELSSGPATAEAEAEAAAELAPSPVVAGVGDAVGMITGEALTGEATSPVPRCVQPSTPKNAPAIPAMERTVNPRGPTRSLRSALSLCGLPRRARRAGRWPWTGLVLDPGEKRRRARHDRGGDDFRFVVAVPFGEECGEFIVAIRRQLEEDKPFLRALQLVVPPVSGRDRPGDLAAGRQPRLDGRAGEFHRLGTRVGGRLNLEVFAA